MSNPERLVFKSLGLEEEICVTPHTDDLEQMRVVGIPRERDIAKVLSGVTDEWFEQFLLEFRRVSPNRAFAVAYAAERASIVSDVAGGDASPGFGVDPQDSARLLELRQAIDTHLSWRSVADEQTADYVGRIKQVGEVLLNHPKLLQKLQRMRKELKRLNRDERERSLAVSLAKFQYASYQDPTAERHRIASLISVLHSLLESRAPTVFTERAAEQLKSMLVAWREGLKQ